MGCGHIQTFNSSKRAPKDPSEARLGGKTQWVVNLLVSVAESSSGVGPRVIRRVLGVFGAWYFPSKRADGRSGHASKQKSLTRVGRAIRVVAKRSATKWLEREVELTKRATTDLETVKDVARRSAQSGKSLSAVTVSGDANWITRGSDWLYSSIAGSHTWLGALTGKIVYLVAFSKACIICERHQVKGEAIPTHVCYKGAHGVFGDKDPEWQDSSLLMESKGCVMATHALGEKGVFVHKYISDADNKSVGAMNDPTRVETEWMRGAVQGLDMNHVAKNLFGALIALKKSMGWGNKSGIRVCDIEYLKLKWSYVMKGLRNEPGIDLNTDETVKRGVNGARIMVKHAFGMHDECLDHKVIGKDGKPKEWCKHASDPENYKPSIKGGEYLEKDNPPGHYAGVAACVETYSSYAVVKMLMHKSSTNENESFHALLVATCPQGKRSNLSMRGVYYVAALCALACKNEGFKYLVLLMIELGLELSAACFHQANFRDNERERRKLAKRIPGFKKNKRDKKEKVSGKDRSGSMVRIGMERNAMVELPSYASGSVIEDLTVSGGESEDGDDPAVIALVDGDDSDGDSIGSGHMPSFDSDEDEELEGADMEVSNALNRLLMPHQVGAKEALMALVETRRQAAEAVAAIGRADE